MKSKTKDRCYQKVRFESRVVWGICPTRTTILDWWRGADQSWLVDVLPFCSLCFSVVKKVRLSAGSHQDLVNCYCSLLTRRTVCGRAAGNTTGTQKTSELKQKLYKTSRGSTRPCGYKVPTTNKYCEVMLSCWVLFWLFFVRRYL